MKDTLRLVIAAASLAGCLDLGTPPAATLDAAPSQADGQAPQRDGQAPQTDASPSARLACGQTTPLETYFDGLRPSGNGVPIHFGRVMAVIDGDGRQDLVLTRPNAQTWAVLWGHALTSAGLPLSAEVCEITLPQGYSASAAAALDLDGDRAPDALGLLASNPNVARLRLLVYRFNAPGNARSGDEPAFADLSTAWNGSPQIQRACLGHGQSVSSDPGMAQDLGWRSRRATASLSCLRRASPPLAPP